MIKHEKTNKINVRNNSEWKFWFKKIFVGIVDLSFEI